MPGMTAVGVQHFSAELIPARFFAIIIAAASLIEGVVLSGVRMTERGAVPDNGIAVERREAQRLYVNGRAHPGAAIPGNGDTAVGAQAEPIARLGQREP